MKIVVAAADPALSLVLEQAADRWARDVVAVDDGESAWQALTAGDDEWLVHRVELAGPPELAAS